MDNGHVRCKNSASAFCYICGQFCPTSQRKPISQNLKLWYSDYFGRSIQNQDEDWVPHITCKSCEVNLCTWWKGTRDRLPFGIPMIWKKPTNHNDDCYFCCTNVLGFSTKTKHKIVYPACSSAERPVLHGDDFPVPISPNRLSALGIDEDTELEFSEDYMDTNDPDYVSEDQPHLIDQSELNDLVRDLDLTKEEAELLASRMLQWKLLAKGTKVTVFRKRHERFAKFFEKKDSIVYCNDINGLMEGLGFPHIVEEWRLFIDGSSDSLKAMEMKNRRFRSHMLWI